MSKAKLQKGTGIITDAKDAIGKLLLKGVKSYFTKAKPKAKVKGGAKKKGVSPWITHVKKYAKTHNIKYGDALKKASASYKK